MGTGTLPWRRFEGRLKEAGTMGTVPTDLDERGADSACKGSRLHHAVSGEGCCRYLV